MGDRVADTDPNFALTEVSPAMAKRVVFRQAKATYVENVERPNEAIKVLRNGACFFCLFVAQLRHAPEHRLDAGSLDQENASAAALDLHEPIDDFRTASLPQRTQDEFVRFGDRPIGGLTGPGKGRDALQIDLALWIGDADHRFVEGNHVGDELRLESHVRIDEQDMRRIGLVDPMRQQEIPAFADFSVRNRSKAKIPTILMHRSG